MPQGHDCGIPLSQLQAAHVGAINTHSVSQLGLTYASGLAQPSHIGAENAPHVIGHEAHCGRMYILMRRIIMHTPSMNDPKWGQW